MSATPCSPFSKRPVQPKINVESLIPERGAEVGVTEVNEQRADDTKAVLEAAAEMLRAGRIDEAIGALEAFVQQYHDCAEAHLLLGDALIQSGRSDEARDSYLLAGCFKPDWPLPWIRHGMLESSQGRHDAAISAFTEAIQRGSDDAGVHNALGAACYETRRFDEALQHFRRALELKPDLADAHSNLGCLLFREMEQFDAAENHVRTALRLEPDNAVALCNQIMILQRHGRADEALSLCNELLARNPQLHEATLNRGLILLGKGDYVAGWKDYEARKKVSSEYSVASPPWPEWDGSSLRGKTCYVYAEQGLGDQIMFASCLPELIDACAACICECNPKLQRIFELSFPKATIVAPGAWRNRNFSVRRVPDLSIAMGSLPRYLRTSMRDFPARNGYLRADPERVRNWKKRLAALPGRRKIGIAWRGGAPSTRASARSIPLRHWRALLGIPNLDFISLQHTECADELAEMRNSGMRIEHWQDAIDDYADTAALIVALDLVISVQTAAVHLTGALGKPVWALIAAVPEWRYGADGETMPWYPSVRLIRQSQAADWNSVIARIVGDLNVWSLNPEFDNPPAR